MHNLDYNLDYIVEYSNDDEYRNCMQNIFMINIDPKDDPNCIFFDEIKVQEIIKKIYDLTCNNEFFVNLYKKSANKYFLNDTLSFGLIVLFSYDHLQLFHKCLYIFLKNGEQVLEKSDCYINLIKNLDNKKE